MFQLQKRYLLLPCLLLVIVSCSQDQITQDSILGLEESQSDSELVTKMIKGPDFGDRAFQNRLESYLNNDIGVEFQLFQQTIAWETGGVIDATPSDWPEGYEIKLNIPPYSTSSDYPGYESVTFGIEVPADGPGPGVTSVPFNFYPDGIKFQTPPELILSWPPWAGTATSEVFTLLNIQTEIHDGKIHYRVPDMMFSSPDALLENGAETRSGGNMMDLCTGIRFYMPHFSRWEFVDGDGADDGGD